MKVCLSISRLSDQKPSNPSKDCSDAVESLVYAPSEWKLDRAKWNNSELIDLVILSSVHRTGSTLLQRLCNARKGTLIWGEHGGLLSRYADIYACAASFAVYGGPERREYFNRHEDPNTWIANMSPEVEFVQRAMVESVRALLNTLYGQYRDRHDVIGFKEVHYGPCETELIRKSYPRARLLLLTRNPFDAWKSTTREWYASFEAWVEQWKNNSRYFFELAKRDARCYFLRYEDLVGRDKKSMEVLENVAGVTRAQADAVFAKKLGSKDLGISENERTYILEQCRETMAVLGYL